MKRPLFPDGFLINAHYSHPSARQEVLPPSFLSPRARPLLLFPGLWRQVEGPLQVGGCQEQSCTEWGTLHLLESSPLRFQVQEPCLSPGGSWNKSRPQPVPALLPKLCVQSAPSLA